MGRRNRECYLCGAKYSYCPTCTQDKMKPSWMTEFHDANCKEIFNICTRFNMKKMSKEEAKEALGKCDLSNKANFKSFIQKYFYNIFAEEPRVKRIRKAEVKMPEIIVTEHEVVTTEENNKAL